jgi:tripeptide aminopeptidase
MLVNAERLKNSFLSLVQIDSESGNEKQVREYISHLVSSWNIESTIDKKGNLILLMKGNKRGPTLLLSAHMDTVKPGIGIKPIVTGDRIASDGTTILGGDDKSGVAEILECIHVIIENKLPHPPLVIAFSVEEEIGVQGVRELRNIKADLGFVLDTDGPIGTVIINAPSHEKFTATIKGKAAHAGIEPEKGINAIVAASRAIGALPLGRIDDETVSNVGIIHGGLATNIIPAEVIIHGEARSRDEEKLTYLVEKIRAIFHKEIKAFGAELSFISTREYDRFDISSNKAMIGLCERAAKRVDVPLLLRPTGGGSDANYFNAFGIPTAVIASGMSKVHTLEEEIRISDMVKATDFLLAIIQEA